MIEISKHFISEIHRLISSDVNFQDERVSLEICVTCRCNLKKLGDGANALKAIQLYSFDSIVMKPLTRLTTCCDCIICQIVKVKGKERHPFEKGLSPVRLLEPNFQQKFASAGSSRKDFFIATNVKLPDSNEIRDIVHCINLKTLKENITVSKDLMSSDTVKLGLDGGGSFFKVSLSLISEHQTEQQSPVKKSIKLASSENFKNTGVKKQLIVAISENTPETFGNVKLILDLMQVNELIDKLILSCDMKLANIICGIQSHSSKHPCYWCNIESTSLNNCGQLRIFGTIREQHQKHLVQVLPKTKEWLTSIHIPLQSYHGGHLNGNDCMKLLKKIDTLKQITVADKAFQASSICHVLHLFLQVVNSCFGCSLSPDFEKKIQVFKSNYLRLAVSVTLKVHAVFYHVPQFLKHHKTGLGIYSEQATEALHSNFKPH